MKKVERGDLQLRLEMKCFSTELKSKWTQIHIVVIFRMLFDSMDRSISKGCSPGNLKLKLSHFFAIPSVVLKQTSVLTAVHARVCMCVSCSLSLATFQGQAAHSARDQKLLIIYETWNLQPNSLKVASQGKQVCVQRTFIHLFVWIFLSLITLVFANTSL